MGLPTVKVTAVPGEAPVVTVDGAKIDGVRSAQVTVTADHIPQVVVSIAAWAVELDLPAGVTVLRAGASAGEFAGQLNPARLEALALDGGDMDTTTGEAFAAAVAVMAAEFDQAHQP